MLTLNDQENLSKSIQNAQELAQNLQKLTASNNPLLADIALELVARSIPVGQRLLRLKSLACPSEVVA